jgi:hypothetical protein
MEVFFIIGLALIAIYKIYANNNPGSVSNMTSNLSTSSNFDFSGFANALGLSESTNDYSNASNGIAYGRYQFIPSTINQVASELNIPTPSLTDFLNNPNLQDQFYNQYVNDIISELNNNGLTSYIGQTITGKNNSQTANINLYGLVAGAWLGGVGGVNNLLRNGYDANDNPGNPSKGTYVSDYIAKFSNTMS